MLDGDPDPPKEGHSPHFSAHVYCGQTVRGIKMPPGIEVGLGSAYAAIALQRHAVKRGNIPETVRDRDIDIGLLYRSLHFYRAMQLC